MQDIVDLTLCSSQRALELSSGLHHGARGEMKLDTVSVVAA
jgi:hypothetical protein